MSRYSNDSRVVLHADGTATLPDVPGGTDGDWLIERRPEGGFTARNPKQGYVADGGDRYNRWPRVFDTADEAIAAIIGDPQ